MKVHWVLFGAAGLTLGVALGVGIHTQMTIGAALTYQRFVAMANLLQQKEDEVRSLQRQIAQLRGEPGSAVARQIVQDQRIALQRARQSAGLVPVQGPGITLWLNDSVWPTALGVNPDAYILHDQDLLTVVNDLNAAGAKGIAINGIRLAATSSIHCAGAVVSIGDVRTSIPVTITAVGEPSALAASLDGKTGELRLLSLYGIRSRLTQQQRVTVPALSGGGL